MEPLDRLKLLIWYTAVLKAAGVYDEPRLVPAVDVFRFYKFCDVYGILMELESESA